MEEGGTYGGFIELIVASKVYKVNFCVLISESDQVNFCTDLCDQDSSKADLHFIEYCPISVG